MMVNAVNGLVGEIRTHRFVSLSAFFLVMFQIVDVAGQVASPYVRSHHRIGPTQVCLGISCTEE